MTTRDPLISQQMLFAAPFRDGLKSLLNLSVDQLQELNSISDSPDGLLPPLQTMIFSHNFGVRSRTCSVLERADYQATQITAF